ncbi:hypothetical protein [Prevotella melaninogenica]
MTDRNKSIRRIGTNIIETATETIEQGIVVIEDGIVLDTYPFTEEEPMTEWTTGTITIRPDNDGKLRAYKGDQLLK